MSGKNISDGHPEHFGRVVVSIPCHLPKAVILHLQNSFTLLLVCPLSALRDRNSGHQQRYLVLSRESYQSAHEKVASVLCTLKQVLIKSHQRCCVAISSYSFYK